MTDSSARAIAARLRGILAGQDFGVIEVTARRLGVSEVSLRLSIDDVDPYPTIDIIVAVVRHYAIDPTWLLTGEYDATTHRAAIDDEAEFSSGKLAALIAHHVTPANTPSQPATLRLEA